MRINPDGTVDAAVRVDVDYVFRELLLGQYDRTDLRDLIPAMGILPSNVNIHGNFSGRVVDNQLQIGDVDAAYIQGIPVPQRLINSNEAHRFVERHITQYIQTANQRTGSSYDLIEVRNGELFMEGEFPDSITRTPR